MTTFEITKNQSEPEIVPNVSKSLFKAKTISEGVGQEKRRPSISYWQDAWIRFRANKIAVVCATYILILIFAAVAVPPFLNYTESEQEIWNKDMPPNLGHLALVMDDGVSMHPASDEPIEPLSPDASAAAADDGSNPQAANPPNDGKDSGADTEAAATSGFADEWGDSGGAAAPTDSAASTEPPTAPTDLKISGEATTLGIRMEWTSVQGSDGYRIYRSINEDGGGGIPIGDVDAEHNGFFDDVALRPETYFYSVRAYNMYGESADSIAVKVTPKLAIGLSDAQRFDPDAKIGETILTAPHYLGTDYLGRDIVARVLVGARYSLGIGLLAPFIYIFIGIIYGSISGYFGKWIDDFMMRVADVILTIPDLLVVILIQVTLGEILGKGILLLIIALSVTAWARSARQIRGQVLQIREMEFVHAAEVLGTSTSKIISRHLLPNVMGTVLVLFTLSVPSAIFTEAFLSFIGLGIEPPTPSWGSIVREGSKAFQTYPHALLIPAAMICITMLAFNLLGDGLRDALDPKLRGAK